MSTVVELTRDEKLELRKTVRAWTDRTRKLLRTYEDAANARAEAMYHAQRAGIPLGTIANDARITKGTAVRNISRWCDKTGNPRPNPKKGRSK